MSDYDYRYSGLATTIHFPDTDQEWEIEGHVYLARDDEFRWDDGTTYVVERVVFVMEKHSPIGRIGLHVFLKK